MVDESGTSRRRRLGARVTGGAGPGRHRHRCRAPDGAAARRAQAVAALRRGRRAGAGPLHPDAPGLPPGGRDDLRGPGRRGAGRRTVAAGSLGRGSPTQVAVTDPARGAQAGDRRRTPARVVELEFWNAGGSGSVEETVADPVVTEVAAGSGLLAPTLFDHYQSFRPRPAAFYGLPVVRRPSPQVATVHGGGFVASGPAGTLTGSRRRGHRPGCTSPGSRGPERCRRRSPAGPRRCCPIGDLVWFRHAKSGEPFEHTDRVHLLQGDRFVDTVPTYRGHGCVF